MKKLKNNLKLQLCLQKATTHQSSHLPKRAEFITWIKRALQAAHPISHSNVEISIRLVDEKESADFNQQYRQKIGPTNILSFPAENLLEEASYYLGDLLICVPLVLQEASEQNKHHLAHWAHLTVHGVLHLLGYDHIVKAEAIVMEGLEVVILEQLGYKNPYLLVS